MTLLRTLAARARRAADRVLEQPWAYRSIQAPFAEAKLAPFFRHTDPAQLRRVLDVGCGPGTNAAHFRARQYTGIDINPDYIATARRSFGERFIVGDVTDPAVLPGASFECVLLNSLLHHLDDEASCNLLSRLSERVAPGGRLHVMELVLPSTRSAARTLARLDRGRYPRPLSAWRALFAQAFEEHVFEPYAVGLPGLPLWQMVYFQGSPRRRRFKALLA
jgi:SAM-dependent methyltransferase